MQNDLIHVPSEHHRWHVSRCAQVSPFQRTSNCQLTAHGSNHFASFADLHHSKVLQAVSLLPHSKISLKIIIILILKGGFDQYVCRFFFSQVQMTNPRSWKSIRMPSFRWRGTCVHWRPVEHFFEENVGFQPSNTKSGSTGRHKNFLRGIDKTTHFTLPTNRVCRNKLYEVF